VPTSRITGPTSRIAEADERDRQQTAAERDAREGLSDEGSAPAADEA
jgi:hypothetical protein